MDNIKVDLQAFEAALDQFSKPAAAPPKQRLRHAFSDKAAKLIKQSRRLNIVNTWLVKRCFMAEMLVAVPNMAMATYALIKDQPTPAVTSPLFGLTCLFATAALAGLSYDNHVRKNVAKQVDDAAHGVPAPGR